MSIVSEGAQGSSSFEWVPPQNIDAEMSILGGMMPSKNAIADVIRILRATDFRRPVHASMYDVVVKLFGRGNLADAVTVDAELKREGELERVGDLPYLHTLVTTVSTAANAAYYADIMREQAQLRSLVGVGTQIVQLGYTMNGVDVEGLVNLAQSEVFTVSEQRSLTSYVTLKQMVPELYEELKRDVSRDDGLDNVLTGFAGLDTRFNRLRAGQMIIIAARPGGGESTLAMSICHSCTVHNSKAAVYFSLEMNRTELSMRLLAAKSRVFLDRMIKGELESWDQQEIARTLDKISQAPLIVGGSPSMTMGEIRAKSRRMKQQFDIQLIVIDYLQLLASGGKSMESRQQEVSEFSRSIEFLTEELEIPIVAVAQLNRGSEERSGKHPQAADLRESGSLKQDVDIVLLVRREDMFNENTEKQDMAGITIGKQRSGPAEIVELAFQGYFSRFTEIAN